MMKTYVAKKSEDNEAEKKKAEELFYEVKKRPINEICSSSRLDALLARSHFDLMFSYPIPRCAGADFVSEKTTGTDLPPEIQFMGTAGLGLKRKTENQQNQQQSLGNPLCTGSGKVKKAKTLHEKRKNLQAEILRYGVAAVEKMYPRQFYATKKVSPVKNLGSGIRNSPIKMKPKPIGFDFAEVDARKILKPFSHDKYIHEPDFDTVVYISRRNGLVPLSSLCKDASTVLPTNVKFISGRNVRLGKPGLYVKDSGRILAIGGSRQKPADPIYPNVSPAHSFKVVNVPRLVKKPDEDFQLFTMDDEYARFAVNALRTIPKRFTNRVDIRTIKRQQKASSSNKPETDLKTVLQSEKRSIVTHLLEKFQKIERGLNEVDEEEDEETKEEIKTEKLEGHSDVEKMAEDVNEALSAGDTNPEINNKDNEEEEEESDEEEDEGVPRQLNEHEENVHNSWSGKFKINEFHEDKPVISDAFRKSFEERKRKLKDACLLNGWEECDIPDCFCKGELHGPGLTTGQVTECQTPTANTSGSQTPLLSDSASKEKKKVAKNLTKVRRALKVLGVNFYEFDDENGDKRNDLSCEKEFCRLGCVCDTLTRKPHPPKHCGKYDCMFSCSCSEDALKIATSPTSTPDVLGFRKGLTDQGSMVQLRSSSLRGMALEERKFVNTVVATGQGGDLLMLGTSAGRQKRERKLPSRYQDTDAFDEAVILRTIGTNKLDDFEQVEGSEGQLVVPGATGVDMTEERQAKRLKVEHLREENIKKATVLVPRLELPRSVKPWCMYHCIYSCPCDQYTNPLDYGPDLTASRNVAKRSLGGRFITTKQESSEATSRPQVARRTGSSIPLPPKPVKPIIIRQNSVCSLASLPANQSNIPALISNWNPNAYKFPTEEHSARTYGMIIRPKNKTQMPQKFLVAKKTEAGSAAKLYGSLPGITSQKTTATAEAAKYCNIEATVVQTSSEKLDLSVKPKGEIQYVRWNVFRSLYERKEIWIWSFYRGLRGTFLVTSDPKKPYTAPQSFELRRFRSLCRPGLKPLPAMIEAMASNEGKPLSAETIKDDKNKYAILSSNGLAWEMNGVLQRKEKEKINAINAENRATAGQTTVPKPQIQLPSVPFPSGSVGPLNTKPMPQLSSGTQKPVLPAPEKKSEEVTDIKVKETEVLKNYTISLESPVAKLPVGKNLVTMTRNGQPVMQIKLPQTNLNQYWSTINVEGAEGSVQCPESSLALKVVVLKQAATLAMKEQTTVRIPIPVAGETESFGVYAVPGLKSHVFVGPFTSKVKVPFKPTEPAELICLDDEEEIKKPEPENLPPPVREASGEDDDIQEVFPSTSSDLSGATEQQDEGFVIKYGDPPDSSSQLPVLPGKKENDCSRKIDRQKAIMGQVPQVVSNHHGEEKEIEIVDLDLEEEPPVFGPPKKPARLPYLNIPPSEFGRVIFRKEKNKIFEDESKMIWVTIPTYGELRVHFTPDKVSFPHPKFASHEVVCTNLDNVTSWIQEFVNHQKQAEKDQSDTTQKAPEIPNFEGVLKTATEVAQNEQAIQNGPKQHVARFFQNGSQKSAAILLDRRKMKDKRKMFLKLNEVVSSNTFKRKLSNVEVLMEAAERIKSLTSQQSELEAEKKSLMIRRTKLFEEFTSKLQGLPVAVKKKAVMDLKEAIKKGKEGPKPEVTTSEPVQQVRPPSQQQQQQAPTPLVDYRVSGSTESRSEVLVPEYDVSILPGPGTPYSDMTGLQTIKKDGKVMRPMNAFMLWAKGYRRELISQGFDGATVSKMLADKWKILSLEQKQQFYNEADHLKNLHQLQHPNYKYSPKARRPGLSKKGSPSKGGISPDKSAPLASHQHQEPRFLPAHQAFSHQGLPALTPRPGMLRVVPQDHLLQQQQQRQQQQQQQRQIVRPPMPGLIQIQSNEPNEEGKHVIEISLE